MRLRDTIDRLRASTAGDGYGNQTLDWSSPAEQMYPADVQPLTSDENLVDQDRTTTRWKLFLYAEADLQPTDRVRWDGQVYEVDGGIDRWKRRGVPHHLEAILVKVTQL